MAYRSSSDAMSVASFASSDSCANSVASFDSADFDARRHMFTGEDREIIIARAAAATESLSKGEIAGFKYNMLEKLNAPSDVDVNVAKATQALANTVYMYEPRFRLITMRFVHRLTRFMDECYFLRENKRHIKLVVKGSTAYHLLANDVAAASGAPEAAELAAKLAPSDFDVTVYINPKLPTVLFNKIHAEAKRVVLRAISDAKSLLDRTFFLHKDYPFMGDEWLLPQEAEAFKGAHIAECRTLGLVSPFESTEVRNAISGNSFMIVDSTTMPGSKVVRVEVPSFKHCETIRLRRSPIIASANDTIDFYSSGGIHRRFELIRLKMNVGEPVVKVSMRADDDDSVELGMRTMYHKVGSDLIDVSIPLQGDYESATFWDRHYAFAQRYQPVLVEHVDIHAISMYLPNVASCLHDLGMMLYVYECPDGKRAKREEKLHIFEALSKFTCF